MLRIARSGTLLDLAIVLCVDEKSQVQALDRSQPGLPMKPGQVGTTTLFAALNSATGKVISLCQRHHRHQEWIQFLRLIELTTPPDKEIYPVAGNYTAHKQPKALIGTAKAKNILAKLVCARSEALDLHSV
jgi:hypothetical protein